MIYKKNIFDVGAYNGIDGLALAEKNPDTLVNAFEANKDLIKVIVKLKKKIEYRIGRKIQNYKIHNIAVSNKSKVSYFYIAKNPTVSSLNKFSKNLDKFWPGYKEAHCHTVKKVKVKTLTLKEFCKRNKIKNINYLHIDTQGNDLNILKGLGDLIKIVKRGVIESSLSKKNSLYQNNHTLNEAKKFFKKYDFLIKKTEPVEGSVGNEINIYYQNKRLSNFKDLKLNYNQRYYYRLLDNRTQLKDDIKDSLFRIFNFFKKV